ncbi:MAG: hypothetical protein ACTHY0_02880 [Mammaliicoccus vitulinus]
MNLVSLGIFEGMLIVVVPSLLVLPINSWFCANSLTSMLLKG